MLGRLLSLFSMLFHNVCNATNKLSLKSLILILTVSQLMLGETKELETSNESLSLTSFNNKPQVIFSSMNASSSYQSTPLLQKGTALLSPVAGEHPEEPVNDELGREALLHKTESRNETPDTKFGAGAIQRALIVVTGLVLIVLGYFGGRRFCRAAGGSSNYTTTSPGISSHGRFYNHVSTSETTLLQSDIASDDDEEDTLYIIPTHTSSE